MQIPSPEVGEGSIEKFMWQKNSVQRARQLRRNQTPDEARLWSLLRNRTLHGLKFRRQQPIDGYITDFCCLEKKLIIELDGAIHNDQNQKEYDHERDLHLKNQGFKILRFSNDEEENVVLRKILEASNTPSPPAGEGS